MGLPTLISFRTHIEPLSDVSQRAAPMAFRWYQYFSSVDALLRALFGTKPNVLAASGQIAVSDNGGIIEMNVAGANNLTVPNNNTVPLPVGFRCKVAQIGAGLTTVVAAGGVTIRCRHTLVSAGQYAVFEIYQRAGNEWVLSGDLA